MAARLTDRRKKIIIADYLEIGSYNAVAKKHKISKDTVRRVVESCSDFAKKTQEKKEQNSADILAHMETKKDKVNSIIDAYLEKLLDPEMISRATPAQLTTALGTLIDKFTMIKGAVKEQHAEDDPLTKALKEEAERMQNANIN